MTKLEKVLYRTEVTATGGRDGRAKSSDPALDLAPSVPKELADRAARERIRSSCLLPAMPPAFWEQ